MSPPPIGKCGYYKTATNRAVVQDGDTSYKSATLQSCYSFQGGSCVTQHSVAFECSEVITDVFHDAAVPNDDA